MKIKTNPDLKYLWGKAVKKRNADSSSIPEVATVESSKHGSSNLRNFVVRREGIDFFFLKPKIPSGPTNLLYALFMLRVGYTANQIQDL
jgi:hypothetical protein